MFPFLGIPLCPVDTSFDNSIDPKMGGGTKGEKYEIGILALPFLLSNFFR